MPSKQSYDAYDIEVLEGLEPVRKRPGMYIGGTDRNGMHHLFSEIIDNSLPTRAFKRVDFPTFGFPIIEINPDL